MSYYEAPTYYQRDDSPKVFLAGGITGCPDWQAEAVQSLNQLGLGKDITIFNPRRVNFPIENPGAAKEQITWEFHHLRMANVILFWFPKEQVQPIALYELGAWSMADKPLAVGAHLEYPRRVDVVVQTSLIRPEIEVASSLDLTLGRTLMELARYGESSPESLGQESHG